MSDIAAEYNEVCKENARRRQELIDANKHRQVLVLEKDQLRTRLDDALVDLKTEKTMHDHTTGCLEEALADDVALREGLAKVSTGEWDAEKARHLLLASPNPGQGLLDVVKAAIEWERHTMWEKGDDDWSPANEALGKAVRALDKPSDSPSR